MHCTDCTTYLPKELIGILIGEWKVDNDILAVLPVGRSGHLLVDSELKRVDRTDDFIKVASGAGRVRHHECNSLVGLEDENTTDCHGQSLAILVGLIENPKVDRVLASGVTEQWKVDRPASGCLDVFDPSLVRLTVVARESTHFDVAGLELVAVLGGRAEFGGADRGKVAGMHKDATPRVTEVLVQVERVRGLGRALQIGEL